MQTSWCVTAGLIAALLAPSFVQAAGFRIYDQSASAAGQSDAFTAQADDASAIYYNPAGMTQLRRVQFSAGSSFVGGSTNYTSPTGQTARGDFSGSVAWPPPSNFYLTGNLKDLGISALGDVTVGLGVTSPFGTIYRYPENGPFATGATFTDLPLLDIKPTVAYKMNEMLSFGLGMDIYTFASFLGEGHAELQLRSSGAPGLPPAGTPLELNGKDTSLGFNASLMYTPFRNGDGKPLVNVGLVYRSQVTLHLEGEFLAAGGVVSKSSTTLVLPQVYTGGIALWPVRSRDREWKLELDVDYTGWKSLRNIDIHLANGSTIPYPLNWRSTYTIMIGTEYKLLNPTMLPDWEVAVRGGYWNSQTPVPDAGFNPTVPDADNHAISIGLGLLCKDKGKLLGLFDCGTGTSWYSPKAIGLDLSYKAILYEDRTVTGSMHPLSAPGIFDGRYQTTFHIGGVNLRVNF